jgi:hypothetical protein
MGRWTRVWSSIGIIVGGVVLAPFTGGASVAVALGTFGYGTARLIGEGLIEDKYARKNIERAAEALSSERVTRLEVRYCHIASDDDDDTKGEFLDAAGTLGARALAMTTSALHHHFVILTLESGTIIYVDKHGRRNVLVRTDRRGKNGAGDAWLSSALLKECKPTRWGGNVNLGDVIRFVSDDERFGTYHLLDANCQHFAEAIYQWI